MAPEQAELKPVSACTDIYALGLVLYEMITGTRAFCGDTPVAIALKQIQEYPTRPREIVPKLSGPLEAVILKCIQKDPAKRYQSVEALVSALQRAATARPVAVWQVSLGRKLRRAELCMRQGLQQSAETARAYLKRQDWRALAKVCTKPAALVVPVFLGGVIAFAMHGSARGNPHTPPPSSLSNVPRSTVVSPAAVPGTNAGIGQFQAPNAISVMTWQEVDLNRMSKTNAEGPQAPAGKLASGDPGAAPAIPKDARLPAPRIVKGQKASAIAATAKKRSVPPVAAQTVVTTSAEQPELLTLATAPQPAPLEAASNPAPKLFAPPYNTLEDASSTSAPKPATTEPKSSAAYLEVGSFKEESWASNAVDKLSQLGFRAFLIHKNFLWSQSYHVQVGPFADPKELTAAREKLASEGFKSHPVN
jgi:cell division protein FtsN